MSDQTLMEMDTPILPSEPLANVSEMQMLREP